MGGVRVVRGWTGRRRGGALTALVVAALLTGVMAPAVAMEPAGPAAADPGVAGASRADITRADDLLANRYRFPPHREVTLPRNLRWNENPFNDRNWQFQFHSMTWANALARAWETTGDRRYRDRYAELLRSWLAANPRETPASPWAWNDHSTALRALVLADAPRHLGRPEWLVAGLRLHGRTLADDGFYVRIGNHALNQNRGLLRIGCVLPNDDWVRLARRRLDVLLRASVDGQGVTNEQSVGYQLSNYQWYEATARELGACGQPLPRGFDRVGRMPDFLAHATLPNGEYELIGDTERAAARAIPGTAAEFAATQGARGSRPSSLSALYDAGYAFGRTGWGEDRPFADETYYSLRFGPPRMIHGHLDHGAVTLYGYGRRLLLDRGMWAYEQDAFRRYVTSREAHNVVTVDGVDFAPGTATPLSVSRRNAERDHHVVRHRGYPGVSSQRRVLFARPSGLLVVHDQLSADRSRTFRQLWQLPEGAAPRVDGRRVTTRMSGGNVAVEQLTGDVRHRVVEGRRDPVQGWQSYGYRQIIPAPTVEAVQTGRTVSYLTLVAPSAGAPAVTVVDSRASRTGFAVLVDVAGERQGLHAEGPDADVVAVTTPLVDAWTTSFHADIEAIYHLGVARGVSPTRYAPGREVTRGQLATHLVALADAGGLDLPAGHAAAFTDIEASTHAASIRRIAAAGIAAGTGDGSTYEPDLPIRRDQMATLLVAFLDAVGQPVPAVSGGRFADTTGSVHRRAIDALAASGVVRGVTATRYAPSASVSRGQMAAFLHRIADRLD